ncbi:MAG: WbqC family protein, partial [Candidatus Latescibacterota bacterium]
HTRGRLVIVAVHQPHYLPWTGYFDKIDSADIFVLLDTVQFEKNGWQNRNRIKTPNGWMWLTVPVEHRFGTSIAETEIDRRQHWERKHRTALAVNYSKAPFYRRCNEFLDDVYSRGWESLNGLNREFLSYFLREMGIRTEIICASSLGALPDAPNERLAALVAKLGGDTYLAGSGCTGYFQPEPFRKAGVRVVFQEYSPVEHPQLHGAFLPGLSVVDVLCNCGQESLEIIRKGRRTVL